MERIFDLHAMCAGLSSGLRCATAPAVTAEAGNSAWAGLLALMALGEDLGDKLPLGIKRIEPGPLFGRIVAGGLTGRAIALRRGANPAAGAGLGAGLAVLSAFAGYNARVAIADTGFPDLPIALIEDAIAFGLARFANAR